MNAWYLVRHWIGVSLFALAVVVPTRGIVHADDSSDAEKRRAAITAILQVGGNIRVQVSQHKVDLLERLPISEIDLRDAEVDNALLIHVGNLKEVRRLDLSNANIDDEGLVKIVHLPLRVLWLQDTKITDGSAAMISCIKTLEFLQLNSTNLSDEFLKELAPMPKLKDLGLRGTLVTGDGMQYILRHPKLKEIDVYNTTVDDAGVASLSQCKSLTSIGLSSTKITNRVFQYLAELPNLTDADLSANRDITTDAVRAFEKAHPNCDIE